MSSSFRRQVYEHNSVSIDAAIQALARGSLPGLRHCARRGLPDNCGLRQIVWQVLIGAAPNTPNTRAKVAHQHVIAYQQFLIDFNTFTPVASNAESQCSNAQSLLRFRISNDVRRTQREHHMFASRDDVTAALERILFVFASLHPRIGYVQGLNEIVAPIFWVFCADNSAGFSTLSENIEVETFYCFSNLMTLIGDCFMSDMDNGPSGITARLANMNTLLSHTDTCLWQHFRNLNVRPEYYALRWFMTLFSREFVLPDVVRIWDVLFSCEEDTLFDFVNSFALAMLIETREELLSKSEFIDVITRLQNYPPICIDRLLDLALQIHHRESRLLQTLASTSQTSLTQTPSWQNKVWTRMFGSTLNINSTSMLESPANRVVHRLPKQCRHSVLKYDTSNDDLVSVKIALVFSPANEKLMESSKTGVRVSIVVCRR